MMLAAFASTGIFLWSRTRKILCGVALAYLAIFIVRLAFPPEQVFPYFVPLMALMRLAPAFLPLALVMGATNVSTLQLSGGEGIFPRIFFTLPIKPREMVLPFIAYGVGLTAALWLVGAAITDGRILMLGAPGTPREAETIAYWAPFLTIGLSVWCQVLLWKPFSIGWLRVWALLAVVIAFFVVVFLLVSGTVTQPQIIAGSLLQIPLAVFVAARGVARDRCGALHDRSDSTAPARTNTSRAEKAASRRPLRPLSSAMNAQLWFEREIHRWSGVVVYTLPVLLLVIFITLDAFGTATKHPGLFRAVAFLTLFMFVWVLVAIGCGAGFMFASFRASSQWQQKEAFSMPQFFAALPMSTGDFVWAKLTAVTTRMLWFVVTATLACAWIVSRSGVFDVTGVRVLALRQEYGYFTAGAILTTPAIAAVLLLLTGTASLTCLSLAGRAWNWLNAFNWTRSLVFGLGGAAVGIYMGIHRGVPPPDLPEILCVLAILKIATLTVLVRHVGKRRLLSWSRLAVILGLWLVTFGALLATALLLLPEGRVSLPTLAAGVALLTPAQGTVTAPLALHLNRVR